SIGKIEAGVMENIIPQEARIMGTCRTLSVKTQRLMAEGLQRISQGIAQAHLARAEVIIKYGYPATDNDEKEAQFMFEVMKDIVGEQGSSFNLPPALTSEDFAYMLERVPGAYGWIGNSVPGRTKVALHSPAYDF